MHLVLIDLIFTYPLTMCCSIKYTLTQLSDIKFPVTQ